MFVIGLMACGQLPAVNGSATGAPSSDFQLPVVTSTEMDTNEFLSVSRERLVYEGNTVYLRGMNFNNQPAIKVRTESDNYGSGNTDDINYSEEDYKQLSDMGGNHVRWGMSFNWYKYNREEFFHVLDQHITWARKYNLWLVLTLFTFPDDCYEGYTYHCPFWNDRKLQQELIDFWVDVADHYKDEPVIAGFDLINEPTPKEVETWFSIAQTIYDAIYDVDPNHLVFVEFDSSGRGFEPLNGENIVYSAHIYSPLALTHADAPTTIKYPGLIPENGIPVWWDKSAMSEDGLYLSNIKGRYPIKWAEQNDKPMYIGEFGARAWVDGYLQYIDDLSDLFDEWGLHYAFFVWRSYSFEDFGIYPMQISLIPWDVQREKLIASILSGSVEPNFNALLLDEH